MPIFRGSLHDKTMFFRKVLGVDCHVDDFGLQVKLIGIKSHRLGCSLEKTCSYPPLYSRQADPAICSSLVADCPRWRDHHHPDGNRLRGGPLHKSAQRHA